MGIAAVIAVWVLGGARASGPPPVTASLPATGTSTTTAPTADSTTDQTTSGGHASSPTTLATPTALRIPGIGVDTALLRLGLNDDDTVEVPDDPQRAGWFFPGIVPGQRGSSVILGHVDSAEGPAVFYRLRELTRGDRILVRMSDGSATRFTVTRVATYPNDEFPAQRVYAGTPRRATLSLVTCGGDYDPDAGGYQANVVVFARLT